MCMCIKGPYLHVAFSVATVRAPGFINISWENSSVLSM